MKKICVDTLSRKTGITGPSLLSRCGAERLAEAQGKQFSYAKGILPRRSEAGVLIEPWCGGGRGVERARIQMGDSPEVMNIRQASEYLGVSPDTLYKYVYEARIPAFKLGNRWKFKKTILDGWMERKSTLGDGLVKKAPGSSRTATGR